jgi:hypothetical protein
MADDDEDMGQMAAEMTANIAAMSPLAYYRWRRSVIIPMAARWRKVTRSQPNMRFYLDHLRAEMAALRVGLRTGTKPAYQPLEWPED